MGWPGLPNRFGLLRARIWVPVILVVSVLVLVGLQGAMSVLDLGWCDERHDLRLACRVVREPVELVRTRILRLPDYSGCRTPLALLRRGATRVWVTDGALLSDGGALIDLRFLRHGSRSQKLARLLPDGQLDQGFLSSADCAPPHKLFHAVAGGGAVLLGGAPDGEDEITTVTVVDPRGLSRSLRAGGLCAVAAGNVRDVAPDPRGWLLLAGEFDIGGETAPLARLEQDGRCTVPFQPPSPAAVTEGFAGTLPDGGVLLRLRRPSASPLLRFQPDGAIDFAYVAAVQQVLLEQGWPWPSDARLLADGSTLLTLTGEGLPALALLDPTGSLRQAIPLGGDGDEPRRVTGLWPLADGGALFVVDGRSRDTAQTLRVPPARLQRLRPDGSLDAGFEAATRDLVPGAGDIQVLDAAADGRLLVVAHWYGVPPQPYTWPWPVESRVFQIDRDGHRVERFAPAAF